KILARKEQELERAKAASLAAESKVSAESIKRDEIAELRQLLQNKKQRAKTGEVGKPEEVNRLKKLCQKYPRVY
ncbi:MAG: hypothetical protein ACKPCP_29330, partial [Sphaerospermopsis kisseleviana]